jgi:trimethylamine--corrinoid protein Co-methyltransferase
MATLNGQNLIHDIGFLESALITSYEMYILTDEAIGMAKHIARGVAVNRDTLSVDVIDAVGHTAGYITQDHTLNFFREECYFPHIMDRLNYDEWEKQGSKTLDIKLKEKADEIIQTHRAEPIDGGPVKSMQKILTDMEE